MTPDPIAFQSGSVPCLTHAISQITGAYNLFRPQSYLLGSAKQ